MSNRKAILFFLIWSAVFALALFLLSKSTRSSAASSGVILPSVDVREVARIDVDRRIGVNGSRELMTIARKNGRWQLEAPVAAEADEASVKRLLDAIMFAEIGHGGHGRSRPFSARFRTILAVLRGDDSGRERARVVFRWTQDCRQR